MLDPESGVRKDAAVWVASVGAVRRALLTVLPKAALSWCTGAVTRCPLPRGLRAPLYGWFARRYGAVLSDVDKELVEFGTLAEFFARPLRDGARPGRHAGLDGERT